MKTYLYLVILFLVIIDFSASAQTDSTSHNTQPQSVRFTISGVVLNHADNKPVAYASVFLSNTTTGAKTADDGTFTLSNVKPGKYELIVSIIGFETYRQKIVVNGNAVLASIVISTKTNMLKEVVIKVDPKRKIYLDWFYERFKTEFLGTSELAKDCKILNPQVLDIDFDEPHNTITATSSDYLEIENDALGYRIKYLLTDFTYINISKNEKQVHYEGPVLFTAMKGTNQQQRRWDKMRQEVYEGSAMHFFRSVLVGKIEENGFRALQYSAYPNPDRPVDSLINTKINLFTRLKGRDKKYSDSLSVWNKKAELPKILRKLLNTPLNREDIVGPGRQAGLFALRSDKGGLYVTYNKKKEFLSHHSLDNLDNPYNTENTLVSFNSPDASFDANGVIVNPSSVLYRGVWGRGRVAWLLPLDYEPPLKSIVYSDSTLTKMASKLDNYTTAHAIEKVYLHLDKSSYGFGDTIWYKAYTVIGPHHQLSALSGVLYVELISPKDSLITRQVLPLTSGIGWSDIPLAHSLKQGTYLIRAYTRWMQNEGADYFYDQCIRIGGIPPQIVRRKTAEHPDVQFFPEGGELVNGVRSRVAIKAIGTNGLGEAVKGTIEDNAGNVVADFTTRHLGMGVFALIPETGKSYKARININGEESFTVNLRKAKETGYTMALNNNAPDSIYIKIATNEQTLNQDRDKTFYIIGQNNGKVYYTSQGKLKNLVYMAGVEKSKFQTGITRFTLFSQVGESVAERIVFVDNDDDLKLNIATGNTTYSKRQKVKIDLTAKDGSGATSGNFSVAVINESKVEPEENTESTIENNLLLTSEIKGYIEQPNYYFTNKSDSVKADLDILLLTQGYRRYDWKQVLSGKRQINAYNTEKTLELNGTLTAPNGKLLSNGNVTLVATSQNMIKDTTTDAEGRFSFNNLYLTDTSTIVLRARNANKGSNVRIKVSVPDYPKITTTGHIYETALLSDTAQYATPKQQYTYYQKQQRADSLKNGKTLKTITITGNKRPKQPELTNSANLNGPGHANKVIMGDQLGSCINLIDCLAGRLPGIILQAHKFYRVRNLARSKMISVKGTGATSDNPMAVIVDGMKFDQRGYDPLSELNIDDIYSVEVLTSGAYLAIYGSNASGGALIITTKRGGEAGNAHYTLAQPSGIITFPFTGFYKAQAFYTPKYEHAADKQTPDNRSTIYWNPNIITDKDGKASFEYYNADTKGTYRVVVEGIDEDGKLGRAVYRYTVN